MDSLIVELIFAVVDLVIDYNLIIIIIMVVVDIIIIIIRVNISPKVIIITGILNCKTCKILILIT